MSHLMIEIVDSAVNDRSGISTDEKTGKERRWRICTQKAYAHVGEAYPLPFDLSIDVENNKAPYQPGRYVLGGKSLRQGKYGVELARYLDLVPVPAPKQG